MSPDQRLPEIVEIPNHPWFVGVQFHPELKSKPFDPHPLLQALLGSYTAIKAGLMSGGRYKKIDVGGFTIANDKPFVLIAGPCQIESEVHSLYSGKISRNLFKIKYTFHIQSLI